MSKANDPLVVYHPDNLAKFAWRSTGTCFKVFESPDFGHALRKIGF